MIHLVTRSNIATLFLAWRIYDAVKEG